MYPGIPLALPEAFGKSALTLGQAYRSWKRLPTCLTHVALERALGCRLHRHGKQKGEIVLWEKQAQVAGHALEKKPLAPAI